MLDTETERLAQGGICEHAEYFPVRDAHLYTVWHQVADPVARVLIAGPFASERHVAYHFLVRWARYLAQHRIEVVRYDYRGIGESTGRFEEARFAQWYEDSRLIAEWISNRNPGIPLLLHGIEFGGLLAAHVFRDGWGDALLIWSPPANANDVLRSSLRRWYSLEQFRLPAESRKTFAHYVEELEQGLPIEVEGYVWPPHLWGDSLSFQMPQTEPALPDAPDHRNRPSKIVHFGKNTGAVLTMPYPRYPVIKDLTPLYRETFDWIAQALSLSRGRDGSNS